MIANKENLDFIKDARTMLAEHYTPWFTGPTVTGKVCAWGALNATANVWQRQRNQYEALKFLNAIAKALHPELVGHIAKRDHTRGPFEELTSDFGARDSFDNTPLVYINNHLGKEAALAVFDAAILDLEIRLAEDTTTSVADTTKTEETKATAELVLV